MAWASSYTVTNSNAGGPGSLRQAIIQTNASGGHDTITFHASISGAIVLTDSLPTVSDDLTISGPGASVLSISGDNAYRVFQIDSSAAVTISDLTIRDGNGFGGGGGGIESDGTLLLISIDIVSNTAAYGGGLYVSNGSTTLNGGQIVSNTADYGGGVYISENASATLSEGQILSNSANDSAGGLYVSNGASATLREGLILSNSAIDGGGGIYSYQGTLTLINTTVSGNQATAGAGGGLFAEESTAAITFTTFASNTATSGGYGIHLVASTVSVQDTNIAYNGTTATNCSGVLVSNGHNLEYGDTCGLTAITDNPDTDPLLGPLTYDHGTLVHPLLEGSPAINAGLCLSGVTTTDQRGVTRVPPCDIGAYEFALQVFLPLVLRSYG
jgi:hypothetical protein